MGHMGEIMGITQRAHVEMPLTSDIHWDCPYIYLLQLMRLIFLFTLSYSSWMKRNSRSQITCTLILNLQMQPVKCEFFCLILCLIAIVQIILYICLPIIFISRVKLKHFRKFEDTTEALAGL